MSHESSKLLSITDRKRYRIDRGVFRGGCGRVKCQASDPTWYSRITQKYYCEDCAAVINKQNPPSIELECVGIRGPLCIPISDVNHPYHSDPNATEIVYHTTEIQTLIENQLTWDPRTSINRLVEQTCGYSSSIPEEEVRAIAQRIQESKNRKTPFLMKPGKKPNP